MIFFFFFFVFVKKKMVRVAISVYGMQYRGTRSTKMLLVHRGELKPMI